MIPTDRSRLHVVAVLLPGWCHAVALCGKMSASKNNMATQHLRPHVEGSVPSLIFFFSFFRDKASRFPEFKMLLRGFGPGTTLCFKKAP